MAPPMNSVGSTCLFQFQYTWQRFECGHCDDKTACEHCRAGGLPQCACTPHSRYPQYQSKGYLLPKGLCCMYKTRRTNQNPWVVFCGKCPGCGGQVPSSADRIEKLGKALAEHQGCCPGWMDLLAADSLQHAFLREEAFEKYCWLAAQHFFSWLPSNMHLFPESLHADLGQAHTGLRCALEERQRAQQRTAHRPHPQPKRIKKVHISLPEPDHPRLVLGNIYTTARTQKLRNQHSVNQSTDLEQQPSADPIPEPQPPSSPLPPWPCGLEAFRSTALQQPSPAGPH